MFSIFCSEENLKQSEDQCTIPTDRYISTPELDGKLKPNFKFRTFCTPVYLGEGEMSESISRVQPGPNLYIFGGAPFGRLRAFGIKKARTVAK